MSIQPVSDLILDVINQADPAKSRGATRALSAPTIVSKDLPVSSPSWGVSNSFSRFMAEADSASSTAQSEGQEGVKGLTSMGNRYSQKMETADLGEKLESAVLQTFVKSMLPKELETVYGGGTAGSMWKGLMAEQLANQLAKSGSIGLAEMLMPDTIRPTLPKEEA
ncbi:rod-binding protein [Pseudovibrio sp. Tun.PSC04-5.I4]|uniref:rod-binding protein n=1 Tax=Pseudovibrio sp. Tun.PSC04-5.I4 TaxID=1798213 RepID=UPI00087EE57B|nr:rod-binding protein [Pseudovibrio sp. Tun.PSC04-5.I4]SDQ93152.1 Rod binding protein [Pseudovibrio sp. Tun.PSC04-5.I4]